MHRNVTILIIILSVLAILGYIIWLKNKVLNPQPVLIEPTPTITQSLNTQPSPIEQPENQISSTSATPTSSSSAVKNSSTSGTIKP